MDIRSSHHQISTLNSRTLQQRIREGAEGHQGEQPYDLIRTISAAERDFSTISAFAPAVEPLSLTELDKRLSQRTQYLAGELGDDSISVPSRMDVLKEAGLGFAMGAGGTMALGLPLTFFLTGEANLGVLAGFGVLAVMTGFQGAAALGESELHTRREGLKKLESIEKEVTLLNQAREMIPHWLPE